MSASKTKPTQSLRKDSPGFSLQSPNTSKLIVQEALAIEEELKARRAIRDRYFWLTECTATKDEQDQVNPRKPFPKRDYIRHLLAILDIEPILFLEKSRTMMASWTCAAWAAHRMFTTPDTTVIFQSKDEDRALKDVEYCKLLLDNSIPALKAKWKTKGDLEPFAQAQHKLEMANGSWCLGIVGNPDKIRSHHPTIVIMDEAAHIPRGEESFNTAQGTRCPHIIALSSAWPGWFRDATEFAVPEDWPEEALKLAA